MDLETRYEKDQTTLSDLSSYYANVTTLHRFSYKMWSDLLFNLL